MKCLQCGVEDWVEGRVEGRGGFQFRPKNSKRMVLSWPQIAARTCKVCGPAQFSVETEKLKSVLQD